MKLILPDSGAQTAEDGRRTAISASRNAEAILDCLQANSPKRGRMLEIAAGTGQHSARFGAAFPDLIWQPTDLNKDNFASISAWIKDLPNVQSPRVLDAATQGWSLHYAQQDAILVVNLLHLIAIAPAQTLIAELALALVPGGVGFVYGPFLRDGIATSEGDVKFDASLRAQDPELGYKDLAWVTGLFAAAGLEVTLHEMPANNVLLVVKKPSVNDA